MFVFLLFLSRMVHVIAMEVLPEERDRKYYADNYSCCPPPLFVILVTLVEVCTPFLFIIFLLYHSGASMQIIPFLARSFAEAK